MGLHVVVLAGGSGTRLWPLSRAGVPKHLLPLAAGGRSLLRATVDRVTPMEGRVWVLTVAAQAPLCEAELAGTAVDAASIIAEPAARGTGPALGLAMEWILRADPEAVVCSVHADHHVADDAAYRAALWTGAGWARTLGGLTTVGVVPTHPATGFGYVELGEDLDSGDWLPPVAGEPPERAVPVPAAHCLGFVEKPPLEAAQGYLGGGSHLWNTGLFSWRADSFLEELRAASEAIADGVAAVAAARGAGDETAAEGIYLGLPSIAVDPLVLEQTRSLVAVRGAFGWSDLGSWADLAAARRQLGEADAAGNVAAGDVHFRDARECFVEARGGRLVAVLGGDGLVVVDLPDALLVLAADRAQEVRALVDELRRERGELT